MKLVQSIGRTSTLWLMAMVVQVSLGSSRSFADGDERPAQNASHTSSEESSSETDAEWVNPVDLYFALVLPPDPDAFKVTAASPSKQPESPPAEDVTTPSPVFADQESAAVDSPDIQGKQAKSQRLELEKHNVAATNYLRDDPPLPPGMADTTDDEEAAEPSMPRPLAAAIESLEPVVVDHPVSVQPTELFRQKGYLPGSEGLEGAGWPCAQCGQCGCSCKPGVTWTFGADAVFLQRSEADGFSGALISSGGVSTRSEDLTFDYEAGPRFRVIRDKSTGLDFEAIYYEIDEWSDSSFLSGPVFALGVDIGNGSARASYSSEFQNFEANVYHDCSNWTRFLAGFRWLRLDEFAAVTASGTNVANFDRQVATTNSLFGGQIGLQHTFLDRGGPLTIDGSIKAGVYNNSIDRSSVGFGTASLADDTTSFVGELDLFLNYELTLHWSATVGYQGIWITDVAQAVDQLFSPAQLFDEETAILNGVRVGATFTW